MKTFLLFLSGMLLTFLIVGGGAFYLLRPASDGPGPSAGVTQPDALIPDSDAIVVKGTLVVPQPLQNTVKSGSGHLVVSLLSGRVPISLQLAVNQKNPVFPYTFTTRLSRSKMKIDTRVRDLLAVYPLYSEKALTQEQWIRRDSFPFAEGYKAATLSAEQVNKKEFPGVIDLGNVYFTIYSPHARNEKCLSDKALVSGTITPSADFLKKYGGKKFALVATPNLLSPGRQDLEPISKVDLPVASYGYQELQFNGKPAAFRLPFREVPVRSITLALVECRPGESLEACAVRRFPLAYFPSYGDNKVFTIMGKGLTRAFCGQTNFEGYVHRMRGELPGKGELPPDPAAGATPLEYLIGTMY